MAARLGAFSATILFSLCIAGCVRRDGRNTDCKWPGETPIHRADPRHLSADAEFAEDLAIRYADLHYGLRTPNYVSGEVYDAARDRCMASLFEAIAKEHGVPVDNVAGALGRNRADIDIAVNLPFWLLYCLAGIMLARLLWDRYPPSEHGWIPGVTMLLFLSLVMAGLGTMLGEMWSWFVEARRIGNDHMSYRVPRLWSAQHRGGLFTGAVMAFWLAAVATARRARFPIRGSSQGETVL